MAAISESFVCAGADTVWSLAMDIDVVGACAHTSDAGANCETETLGLSAVVFRFWRFPVPLEMYFEAFFTSDSCSTFLTREDLLS